MHMFVKYGFGDMSGMGLAMTSDDVVSIVTRTFFEIRGFCRVVDMDMEYTKILKK